MRKLLTILIFASLVFSGCQKNLGGDALDVSSLQKINIVETKIGEKNFLQYKSEKTGKIEIFEVTKEEYDDVSLRNQQPAKKGYIFVGGFGGSPVIATSAPILSDMQYYVVAEKTTTTPEIIKYKKDGIEAIKELTDEELILIKK